MSAMPRYAILGGPQTTPSFDDLLVASTTAKGDKAKLKRKGTWGEAWTVSSQWNRREWTCLVPSAVTCGDTWEILSTGEAH